MTTIGTNIRIRFKQNLNNQTWLLIVDRVWEKIEVITNGQVYFANERYH